MCVCVCSAATSSVTGGHTQKCVWQMYIYDCMCALTGDLSLGLVGRAVCMCALTGDLSLGLVGRAVCVYALLSLGLVGGAVCVCVCVCVCSDRGPDTGSCRRSRVCLCS